MQQFIEFLDGWSLLFTEKSQSTFNLHLFMSSHKRNASCIKKWLNLIQYLIEIMKLVQLKFHYNFYYHQSDIKLLVVTILQSFSIFSKTFKSLFRQKFKSSVRELLQVVKPITSVFIFMCKFIFLKITFINKFWNFLKL